MELLYEAVMRDWESFSQAAITLPPLEENKERGLFAVFQGLRACQDVELGGTVSGSSLGDD